MFILLFTTAYLQDKISICAWFVSENKLCLMCLKVCLNYEIWTGCDGYKVTKIIEGFPINIIQKDHIEGK